VATSASRSTGARIPAASPPFADELPSAFSVNSNALHPVPTRNNLAKGFQLPFDVWFPGESSLNGAGRAVVPAMQMTFDADWVSPRGYGSCYVRVPNLTAPPPPYPPGVLTPSNGRVRLSLNPNGAAVDPVYSVPPPTDPRGPDWQCDMVASFAEGRRCTAVSVVTQPGSSRDSQFLLLFSGALLGLGLAIAAEALLKWRWPLPNHD
jgi:hypothetical protein